MAAQGRDDQRRSCPRCFALVEAIALYCPECGASFDPDNSGSDSEVYQDLAKANLLRMRGHQKEAMDVCLGILRRYPNNMTAHSLLGDIYFEQEDFKQASEWYEMALDLSPGSPREQQQLEISQRRLKEKSLDQSLDQLEIKKKPFNPAWYAFGLVFLLVGVAIAAFMIGQGSRAKNKSKPVEDPITIQAPETNQPVVKPQVKPPVYVPALAAEKSLLQVIHGTSGVSSHIDSLTLIADTGQLIVTMPPASGMKDPVAALIASGEIFGLAETVNTITIRIHKQGVVSFSGSITSQKYEECRTMVESGQTIQAAADFAFQSPGDSAPETVPDPATDANTESDNVATTTGG